jgi:hypothetical protein
MSRFVLVLIVSLTPLFVGCEGRPAAGLYNNSGRTLIGRVHERETPVIHRSLLGPGVWKVNSPWSKGVPETATVSWQEGDGQQFDRDVPVRNVLPQSFNGTVWFKIEADRSVAVVPVSRGEANEGIAGPDAWVRERRD